MLYTLLWGVTLKEVSATMLFRDFERQANQLIQENPAEKEAVVEVAIQRIRKNFSFFDFESYANWIAANAPEKISDLSSTIVDNWMQRFQNEILRGSTYEGLQKLKSWTEKKDVPTWVKKIANKLSLNFSQLQSLQVDGLLCVADFIARHAPELLLENVVPTMVQYLVERRTSLYSKMELANWIAKHDKAQVSHISTVMLEPLQQPFGAQAERYAAWIVTHAKDKIPEAAEAILQHVDGADDSHWLKAAEWIANHSPDYIEAMVQKTRQRLSSVTATYKLPFVRWIFKHSPRHRLEMVKISLGIIVRESINPYDLKQFSAFIQECLKLLDPIQKTELFNSISEHESSILQTRDSDLYRAMELHRMGGNEEERKAIIQRTQEADAFRMAKLSEQSTARNLPSEVQDKIGQALGTIKGRTQIEKEAE